MPTEDERLKKMFAHYFDQDKGVPDFDSMWDQAVRGNKKTGIFWLKIAAGVALILTLGTLVVHRRGHDEEKSVIPLAAWTEPTVGLQKDSRITTLSQWSSPTDFLLTGNKKILK